MQLSNEELQKLVSVLNEQEASARRAWNNKEHCLLNNMRSRVHHAIKRQSGIKATKTISLVGCGVDELIKHLESKFDDKMNWENYGEWHVDHVKPCASFDLSTEADQMSCFHYSNLQPLWASDNQKKSNK